MKIILSLLLVIALVSCKKANTPPATNISTTNNTLGKYGNGVTDIDGNNYKSTIIGKQEWMAENLKVSTFNDGTSISNVKDGQAWSNLNTPAWCYYNNSDSLGKKYGKLYNWYAIDMTSNGKKNVCPTGWHVPNQNEWSILIDYLGGNIVAGGKLKETGTINWFNPNSESTNSSLFTGLPSGYRSSGGGLNGEYFGLGTVALWWSSTEYSSNLWSWGTGLNYSSGNVGQGPYFKQFGIAVRCIKDSL